MTIQTMAYHTQNCKPEIGKWGKNSTNRYLKILKNKISLSKIASPVMLN